MNFWHMQLHPGKEARSNFPPAKVKEILEKTYYIGLEQWEQGKEQIKDFKEQIQLGDIVAIRDGHKPIALVKVVGDYEYFEKTNPELDWFPHRRKIQILDFYDDKYDFEIAKPQGTLDICRNLNCPTSKTIIKWYEKYKDKKYMKDKIELLEYKKQIILQGPPGTGKTRAAKLIAEELIQPRKGIEPEIKINDLVKNFNPNDKDIITARKNREKLLSDFYTSFPKEDLNKLTLETYCIGKGEQDNFCWWIERGLKSLGYYFPGSARSYLIFWKKELDGYSKHGIAKDFENNDEAMQKIANIIHEVVNTKNVGNAVKYLGDSFLLKLLNTYYPDEYFPINSERLLNNALKIFKVNIQGLSVFEKNRKLNQIYIEKTKKLNNNIDSYEFGRLLWENFNLKTGADIDNKEGAIVESGEFQTIQFHPAYSYEDFVRGIVAETTEDGKISYQVKNKIFADFAQKAKENPNNKYVLIIDEINRANLPSVLGELIYALEYRNEPVTSMYEYEGEREIVIPNNLYIIGTMNTADRSVGHIDYAIRRRFAFVDMEPDETVIEYDKAKKLFNEVKSLFAKECLSPEFKAKDVMIGHSYFIVKDDDELKIKLEYEIKPILREYVKDGILFETALEKVEALNV